MMATCKRVLAPLGRYKRLAMGGNVRDSGVLVGQSRLRPVYRASGWVV